MKREKRLKLLFLALLVGNLNQALSQKIEKIRQELQQSGLENLRLLQAEGKLTLCFENITYRWQVMGIVQSIDQLTDSLTEPVDLEVILLEKNIPRLLVKINSADWKNFRNGNLPAGEFSSKLKISAKTEDAWNRIKNLEAGNKSTGKFDLIVYPQFAFKNTLKKKLYEVQLNLAPAIEFSMWKGMNFTGQVIFPIINELGYEGGFIRPGYVTLSQEFRLPRQWFVKGTAGNFSDTRYGIDFLLKHPLRNERWNIELNAGLTGSSHFFDYKWTNSSMNTLTWSVAASYYVPQFDLKLKAGAAQYIYKDRGLFASCTRFFGEKAFGFYALLGEHDSNGGFHLSFPLPFQKRSVRKLFRISVPKYYEMTYDGGTEFLNGQSYGTSPDQNRINNNNHPDYLINEIIKLNK